MGESITEGTITKWLKKVGDTIVRDEPIFEISTDKVDAEIPSPVAGVLTEIKAAEGTTVAINSVVALIGGSAGASAPAPSAPAATPAPASAAAAPSASVGEAPRSSPLVRKMAKDNGIDLAAAGIEGTGSAGRITKTDMAGYLQGGAKPAAGICSRGCRCGTCCCSTRTRQGRCSCCTGPRARRAGSDDENARDYCEAHGGV